MVITPLKGDPPEVRSRAVAVRNTTRGATYNALAQPVTLTCTNRPAPVESGARAVTHSGFRFHGHLQRGPSTYGIGPSTRNTNKLSLGHERNLYAAPRLAIRRRHAPPRWGTPWYSTLSTGQIGCSHTGSDPKSHYWCVESANASLHTPAQTNELVLAIS